MTLNTAMTNSMRSSAAPSASTLASASATSSNSHRNNNPKIRPHRKTNYRKQQRLRGGKFEGKMEVPSPSSSSSFSSLTMTAAASAAAAKETTTSTGKGNGQQKIQRIKFHSSSCERGNNTTNQHVFDKLDPDTPQGAQRLASRRKAIEKGKNTIGYDEYCRQVPKDKRRHRSMETPSTPDHTLDIPNRQWNGMVKAWRIALHRYDPVELKEAFAEAEAAKEKADKVDTIAKLGSMAGGGQPKFSVQEQELEQAKKAGLLDLVVVQQQQPKPPNDHESASTVFGGGSTVPFFGSAMTSHGGGGAGGGFTTARTSTTVAAVGKVGDTKATSLKETSSPSGVDGWDSVMAPVLVGAKASSADDDGNSFISEGDMSDDDLL